MKFSISEFTEKGQGALRKGQQIAEGYKHQLVGTPHLLLGIIEEDEALSIFLLEKQEVNIPQLRRLLEGELKSYPKVLSDVKRSLTDTANQAMLRARKASSKFDDEYISLELMLLGIAGGNDRAAAILKEMGVTSRGMKKAIEALRKGRKVTSKSAENSYNALKKYAINLNERAENNKLDPIIGRDEEIRRVLHILSRRKKNNPILIGEPGVGKTAIVEGIAWRIVNKDVPENLQSKIIYTLDISSLIAGAKYKGEFEERLKSVVKEVTSSNGEIILFIDEIHTLIGAGGGNGAMDAANILKPVLARGELRTLGATTLDEYQKYFEKDKALVRRFQTVVVEEPSIEDTISILRGLQERYEIYHKIEILDEALVAAVELSKRYIQDRFLPDKAIDLIDEAAAKMRLELDSVPAAVDEWDRKVRQLNMEREAIKREKNEKRLAQIKVQIANATEKRDSITAAWQNEKDLIDTIQNIKKKMEALTAAEEKAIRNNDYEEAGRIRNGELVTQQAMLQVAEEKLGKLSDDKRFTNEEVTAEDIAEVISKSTGIPVNKMLKSEQQKLLLLEDELHGRVIGQNEAVHAVANAVRRARAGLQDENRPIGSFLFLGPTGVGKTELAKALAEILFDDERSITRIDMSEFQEAHNVSRLIGAPPGYVGYDEGGQLTEAVRRKPYSIVLLDEIEKAHPDVYNILLQVLDDGRLTDNKGRVANFRNTIIIMTSNMGAEIILENFEDLAEFGEDKRGEIIEATKQELFELLKEDLAPEFLNRIDERIVFLPLTQEEIKQILGLLLKKTRKMLAKQGMVIDLAEPALDWLAKRGYDPQFGARPLKRVLQRDLIDALSKDVIAGNFVSGDTIYVTLAGDKKALEFAKKPS